MDEIFLSYPLSGHGPTGPLGSPPVCRKRRGRAGVGVGWGGVWRQNADLRVIGAQKSGSRGGVRRGQLSSQSVGRAHKFTSLLTQAAGLWVLTSWLT